MGSDLNAGDVQMSPTVECLDDENRKKQGNSIRYGKMLTGPRLMLNNADPDTPKISTRKRTALVVEQDETVIMPQSARGRP